MIKNISMNITDDKVSHYDKLLKLIEKYFKSEEFDTSNLDKGNDEFIPFEDMLVILTTTLNQKNNINNNKTLINLEECEYLLRKFYNISDNETLYIKKIDVIQKGMKIPKIEYDIYSKLSGTNLEKLNISICENSKIFLSIPIKLKESLDILNSSSDYYNDICYITNENNDIDIILKDRQKEFIEGKKTVCQDDCDFYDYNYNTLRVNCSCKAKESSESFDDIKINITKLYENFKDINNKNDFSNLGITSCDVLSSVDNIKSNTGFYLLLFIIVIFIITFIIFCIKGYNTLENKIDEVIFKKFKNEIKLSENKIENSSIKKHKNSSKKGNKLKHRKKDKKSSTIKSSISKNDFLNKKQLEKKGSKNINSSLGNQCFNQTLLQDKFKPETDYELNWLLYEDAIKYDKRTSCDYYSSLLKYKQLFIFTFCSFNDYNSGIVKKFMLFLSFALHYTISALFFTDEIMHQIYEDKGKYNFGYQIPYILFSTIISIFILRLMLHILILTDKDVLQVKLQPKKDLAIKMKKEKLKCIIIKFSIFFVLNFILLVLFWYYLTCFNAIYKNTQIYLIENTFISFGFSLIYPFIINIIPTMIRTYALHSPKKNQRYFYKSSQIIQLI